MSAHSLLSWALTPEVHATVDTMKILSSVGFSSSVTEGMALVTVTIHLH